MSAKQNVSQARVYRFDDSVAFTFHHGGMTMTPTLYMPADLARFVGELLIEAANNIDDVKFTKSELGTWLAEWVIDHAELRKE